MDDIALPTEIAAALCQLDEELADGDITTKGYLKRRTQLFENTGLSTYLNYNDDVSRHRPVGNLLPTNVTLPIPDPLGARRYSDRGPDIYEHVNRSRTSRSSAETEEQSSDQSTQVTQHINDQFNKDDQLGGEARFMSSTIYHDSDPPQPDARENVYYPQAHDYPRHLVRHPEDEYIHTRRTANSAHGRAEFFTQTDHADEVPQEDRAILQRDSLERQHAGLHAYDAHAVGPQLEPLEARGLPFAISDPHNPNVGMSKFDNIAAVLRHRGRSNPKKAAFMVLDIKGKELATITWDKLASRAEKVAQVIRDKSGLYRGDRVALVYRDCEVIDFTIALYGCFIAGVVAVPINKQEDFHELTTVLAATQSHLALTTDTNLKAFHRELSLQKLSWPRGVEWWKTNEFGSYHPKKKDDAPPLQAPDLAYVEYSRSPTGELRGVVISHRTVMHQMACLSATVSTAPTDKHGNCAPENLSRPLTPPRSNGEVLLTYLDPRQAIGMILGVLLAVYHGNTTIWCSPQAVVVPGLLAHLITRYRATLLLADYPGLKTVAYNYQNDPMATRGKKHSVDFSSIKLCLVDCLTVDTEFHEILADRWLRPLGNIHARQVLAPMLCLPEHGGMVISMKDWLEGQERIITSGVSIDDDMQDISEVLVDQEALKSNEVVLVATGLDVSKRVDAANTVRVGSFWFPLADATLAVVDPETSFLCPSSTVGEIWIDSPSMSACYWLLPRHTDTIFHARPYQIDMENGKPQIFEQEFLRTGLLGFIIQGRVFVLGLYEDRLRQRVEWQEEQQEFIEYRYHYVSHLVNTIMRKVPKVFDCSAFDVYVNKEHLPVVLLESPAASTAPLSPSGPARILDNDLLGSLADKVIESLLEFHQVRVYCVLICAPNTLPRVSRNGRKEIGNMLCRKEFERGTLPSVLVRFAVERAVLNLPVGEDPVNGIWSRAASGSRAASLQHEEQQYSGFDDRLIVLDDRTSTNLSDFTSIVDIFQWRSGRQVDELALCSIDSRGREGKPISWKKLDMKIAGVAALLRGKLRLRSGSQVILMYTHTEEFFFAVHACLCLGITAIPVAPLDASRLAEDVPALLSIVQDHGIRTILVNNETSSAFSTKAINQHLKQSAIAAKLSLPQIVNTTKPPKQTKSCRELGFVMETAWLRPGFPAIVWIYWSPDQRRTSISIDHEIILGCCKVQKETCQMSSSRPVLGCVRSTSGLGFLQSCLIGPYVGCATYYLSPVEFGVNPMLFLQVLSRYKMKDCYATPQTVDHIMTAVLTKGSSLHELKNLMVAFDNRPGIGYYSRMRTHLGPCGLEASALNSSYGHVINPLIATRSYMCTEPIELYLDSRALREGFVQLTNPTEDPFGLVVQDSGMVPVCTQIAIVNPETRQLCRNGEFGEIWVSSPACASGFYGSKDMFDMERFNGQISDVAAGTRYVRSGDLGFLYSISRPIGSNNGLVEVQTLFVLGNIGETFEVNGLNHFPIDIETSIEKSHRSITRGGSAVFQAGDQVILLVEVLSTNHLSSIVPVIVNVVLDEHQIVIDKIAFCARGDFPRSRLREKQRGKILASWITQRLKSCIVFNVKAGEVAPVENDGLRTLAVPETIQESPSYGV